MPCCGSVRLKSTWQDSQDDVPTYRCAAPSATAPAPTAADIVSGVPATTGTPAARPERLGGVARERAEHGVRGQQLGKFGGVHAAAARSSPSS